MSLENAKRRERAEAALGAVPSHYDSGEEGITDAITDLTHLAASRGVDVDVLYERCRGNFEAEDDEEPRRDHYALVAVLEAASPEQAWEAASGLLGGLEGGEGPDCLYVGAPWQGIPAEAEELSTDHLELAMLMPNGGAGLVPTTAVLRACE